MINYKIGDKVKFLNDVGGGTVTKVIGKNLLHVENEDGFEIPTLVNEVVLVAATEDENVIEKQKPEMTVTDFVRQSNNNAISKRQEEQKKTHVVQDGKDELSVHLAFVPENANNPLDGATKVYLINDSNYHLLYNYMHFDGYNYSSQANGSVRPNTKISIGELSSADIPSLPEFVFQLISFKDESSTVEQPIIKKIKVNPVKFYKASSFRKTAFFTQSALLFELSDSEMSQALKKLSKKDFVSASKEKEDAKERTAKANNKSADTLEVDLHIHELIDDDAGLSPKDILEYQLNCFHKQMQDAVANKKLKRIIFIHGLGNGVLKNEVRKELARSYKKYYVQDASFQEYGYGATMVILRK